MNDDQIIERARLLNISPPAEVKKERVALEKNHQLLCDATNVYNSFARVRARRRRSRKYYIGDQWSDSVTVNGVTMTEAEYLAKQGRAPIKQNMIKPPIKNIIGQYRSNPYKPIVFSLNRDNQVVGEMMTCALESVLNANGYKNKDARMLEEFLISGIGIYKITYAFDDTRERSITDFKSVNANLWACNPDTKENDGSDVRFIVELKDMTIDNLISEYAKYSSEEEIRRVYAEHNPDEYITNAFDGSRLQSINASIPLTPNKCRVIEVWKKEGEWSLKVHDKLNATYEIRTLDDIPYIEKENERRSRLQAERGVYVPGIDYEKSYTKSWFTYHLSDKGDVLYKAKTPYKHNSHPYSFILFPLLDGEVWGMVEDLIDQQKMVNRNMVLFDFVIGASAKGVLLVPEDCIPDNMDIQDFAQEWTKYNGVIKIKAKAGAQIPQQIATNSTNIGLVNMIEYQLKFMQEISGVSGAIQGQRASSGTAASLYAQESQNATLNVLDYIETFASFLSNRDKKVIQVIQQYDTEEHYIASAEGNYSKEAMYYDPEKIANIDLENTVTRGKDTPAFRVQSEEILTKLLDTGRIPLELYLEHSSQPFSDKLLQSIRMLAEQQQGMQMEQVGPPQNIEQ